MSHKSESDSSDESSGEPESPWVSDDPGLTACDLVNLDSDIETGTVYSNQTFAEMTERDTDFSITSSESSHQPVVKMMTQPDDSEGPQAADMDSTDSRPAPLRCPESRNTDDEIQVSFSHAEPASNLNERFTQYRERTRSHIQNSRQ